MHWINFATNVCHSHQRSSLLPPTHRPLFFTAYHPVPLSAFHCLQEPNAPPPHLCFDACQTFSAQSPSPHPLFTAQLASAVQSPPGPPLSCCLPPALPPHVDSKRTAGGHLLWAAAVRQMLDEVTGLRYLMTLWRLWSDVESHMLVSYRACFVNILKVGSVIIVPVHIQGSAPNQT